MSSRTNGPAINNTYFLGYFREDYEYIAHPNDDDYLDEHNGRNCITPEYPNGTYAYFATVDDNWNSAYPYAVGPTFYGVYSNASVNSINETTTVYTPSSAKIDNLQSLDIQAYPNPTSDFIAIQLNGLINSELNLELIDLTGKIIKTTTINPGSTIGYFDTATLYSGTYIIHISNDKETIIKKVMIK